MTLDSTYLDALPYFTLEAVGKASVKRPTLFERVRRSILRGEWIRLKQGVYVTHVAFDTFKKDIDYLSYLSQVLLEPSYVSDAYVLQKYQILSEAVYTVTAVTTKTPRSFASQIGNFDYRHVKADLFSGFEYIYSQFGLVAEATLAKAMFDYLYRTSRLMNQVDEQIVREMRFNLEQIDDMTWDALETWVSDKGTSKMGKIIKILERLR